MIKVCPEINQNISLINNTHQEQNESNFLDPSEQQSSFYKQQYLEQKIVAIVNFKEAQIKKIDGKECFSINPFIEVRHKKKINQVFSSTVSHVGGLYPQWNHKAQMLLEKLDDTQELEISLKRKYSCNSTSNQLLGQIYVKIFDLIYNENLNKIGLDKNEILFTDQWVDIQQNEKNLKNQIGKLFNPFKNAQNILKESQKEQVQIIGRIRIQIMMIPYNDFNQQCNIINDWDSQFKFEQIQIQQNWLIFQKQVEIQNQINQVDINKKEIIEDIKDNPYILHTTDKLRIIWDIIIGLFILVSSILTPLNLAFPQYRLQNEGYSSFMYVVDAVFIMDIFLNFISAYEDQFKVQHTDFYAIALNYFQSWMFVDVFSILPFDLIFIYAIPFINYSDSYNRILKSLKFIKLFNMFDTVQDIIQKCLRKSKSKSTNAFKKLYFLMTFMIVFLLICHQIACIWIFIGRESLFETIQNTNNTPNLNWLMGAALDQATDYQQYTAAFYFTVTTMATVGYGDISGRNTLERIICVMIMIIGVVTFSIVSGQILSIIQSQDQDQAYQQKQIDLIDKFQEKLQFPKDLYSDLIKQTKDEIGFDFQEDINEYIISLPKNLQFRIFDTYYNNIFYKIYFLQNKPNKFIHWIQPFLQQEIIEPEDYFYVQNDEIEYISFLFDGSAYFTLPLSQNKDYVKLQIGDDFGQLDILFQCVKQKNTILEIVEKKENFKRFFTLQAQSLCQVYHLNVDILKSMAQKFPEAFDSIFYDSDKRLKQLLNFQLQALQTLDKALEIEIKSLKEIFSEDEIVVENFSPRISENNALRKSTQYSVRQSLQAQNQDQEVYIPFDKKKQQFLMLLRQITKNNFSENKQLKEIDIQINEQQKLISKGQNDDRVMDKDQYQQILEKIDKLLIQRQIYLAQQMIYDIQSYQSKFENSEKKNASQLAKDFNHDTQNIDQQFQKIQKHMDNYYLRIDKIEQQLQLIAQKL